MKREKSLYYKITDFSNLLLASRKAQKGKRFKKNVLKFNHHLENELIGIRDSLISHTYRPGPYHVFKIYDPKERLISAAAYRDRVVHHALCNVIEPVFEKTFIFDSYANRTGKGTHRAINRFQEFAGKNRYVLKADIRKYFPSIDLEILKSLIRRKIACPDTLWLIYLIIDNSNQQEGVYDVFPGDDLFTPCERRKGIPIGNLTSQFFANIYLNPLDHFIKEELKCRYYVRYVDDFAVFDNDKKYLHQIKEETGAFLESLRLRLHENKTKVFRVETGIGFLGHMIFPDFRLLKKENLKRFRRRLKRQVRMYESGMLSLEKLRQSLQSWNAHASYSDTYRLRKEIFDNLALQGISLI